jgi:hypothetical protein
MSDAKRDGSFRARNDRPAAIPYLHAHTPL